MNLISDKALDRFKAFEKASQEDRIEMYRREVRYHDVTYDYSDDPSMYRRGSEERSLINRMAEMIPNETAVEIWNERMISYFGDTEEAQRWMRKVKS